MAQFLSSRSPRGRAIGARGAARRGFSCRDAEAENRMASRRTLALRVGVASLVAFVGVFGLVTRRVGAAATVLVGDTTVEPAVDYNPAGVAEAFPFTATAGGTVSQINVYVDAGASATRVAVGMYADAAGHPGAMLTQGIIGSVTNAGWNTATVPSVSVASGTQYWLALLAPLGAGVLKYRDKCCASPIVSESANQASDGSLPTTWTRTSSWSDGPASIYAATAAAPGPVLTQVAAAPTNNGATITWTTDVPATSQVAYGPTAQLGTSSPLDAALTTSHSGHDQRSARGHAVLLPGLERRRVATAEHVVGGVVHDHVTVAAAAGPGRSVGLAHQLAAGRGALVAHAQRQRVVVGRLGDTVQGGRLESVVAGVHRRDHRVGPVLFGTRPTRRRSHPRRGRTRSRDRIHRDRHRRREHLQSGEQPVDARRRHAFPALVPERDDAARRARARHLRHDDLRAAGPTRPRCTTPRPTRGRCSPGSRRPRCTKRNTR